MTFSYIFLLPAALTNLWALYVKFRQRKILDLVILLLCTLTVALNASLVYEMTMHELSVGVHIVQMSAAALVVPLGYLYFSRQTGNVNLFRSVNLLLWALAALVFVPQLIICNPFEPFVVPASGLKPFAFYVLNHGQKVVAIYMGDLVIILQSAVVIYRTCAFVMMIHRHKLQLNRGAYLFGAYWFACAIIAMTLSCMTYADLRDPDGSSFYFCAYSLSLLFFNVLIIKGYDLHLVETEQGVAVDNVDFYVQHQFSEMAAELRHLMEHQQIYTDPQLTAERVSELLHTNHTYFSQMMAAELGISFTDYIGNLRLAHVETLLPDSSLSVTTVAQQSGFADPGYMTKKFKAKHGVTPTEWRKTH